MALYVVVKRNPFVKQNAYYEKFDDGWQQAIVEQIKNRINVIGNKGFMLPDKMVKPFVMRILTRGLDK